MLHRFFARSLGHNATVNAPASPPQSVVEFLLPAVTAAQVPSRLAVPDTLSLKAPKSASAYLANRKGFGGALSNPARQSLTAARMAGTQPLVPPSLSAAVAQELQNASSLSDMPKLQKSVAANTLNFLEWSAKTAMEYKTAMQVLSSI